MKKPILPKPVKFAAAKQRRLDQLLEKNSEGTLTSKEKAKLEQLVAEAEQLMVANAKRLAKFAERARKRAPTTAVPVTIWVQPEHAER
jgi:hypothetical protein